MRVTQTSHPFIKTVSFEGDLPDGGCLVSCPCGEQFSTKNEEYDKPKICKCGVEVFYPGWASW